MLEADTFSLRKIEATDHVHTGDGLCVKNRHGVRCEAEPDADRLARAVRRRTLRGAASDLERRAGLYKNDASDKVRRQMCNEIAGWLRDRCKQDDA